MEELKIVDNGEKWIKHYSRSHKILLVGEGDFSFAACLAKTFGYALSMFATFLNSREELVEKYSNAKTNLKELKVRRCTVWHEMDANYLTESIFKYFDRIIFNFPRAGFIWRERDDWQIQLHRELVRGFFENAKYMLKKNGEIHITHKTSYPFNKWEIKELAEEVGLRLLEEVLFKISDYLGYVNKRGSGSSDESFPVGVCSTYKFRM